MTENTGSLHLKRWFNGNFVIVVEGYNYNNKNNIATDLLCSAATEFIKNYLNKDDFGALFIKSHGNNAEAILIYSDEIICAQGINQFVALINLGYHLYQKLDEDISILEKILEAEEDIKRSY